jgi:hypothetical protein
LAAGSDPQVEAAPAVPQAAGRLADSSRGTTDGRGRPRRLHFKRKIKEKQMKIFTLSLMIGILVMASGCTSPKQEQAPSPLAAKIKRFAPTVITGDVSRLSPGDREALKKLVRAAALLDTLYAHQAWSGTDSLRARLEADTSAEGKERLHFFTLNGGPWSKLDHDAPFIEGVPATKPPQANYYPPDMTKEEFNTWVASLPGPEQKKATGFFYTVRRNPDRTLRLVPYSEEYRDLLEPAAALLRDAAALTDNASLKKFLTLRADAFLSNDYYASDVAWMDLDSPIEPTIGPYEVYMDELFNYKAAFEAYICLRDDEETAKLAMFSKRLQEIENNLPIEKRYRNPKLGAMAPIRVVDEIAQGGEARPGVQAAAFNLPNDERVTTEKGSKRVMLKNIQEAKFRTILAPIAATLIDTAQRPKIAFDPFFTFILAHELMHGLGPHSIVADGRATTARQAMKDLSSAFEEAKADISALFALQYLIDTGALDRTMEESMYVTFLAGIFRSVRFGLNEAHGKGMALQFNYLADEGAIVQDTATGRFTADIPRFKQAARKLTAEIMTIQAEGAYDKAAALISKYAVIRPGMKAALDRLSDIPVDIEPLFPTIE